MSRTFVVVLTLTLAAETGLFLWRHQDIVVLTRSAASLAADDRFPDLARRALERDRLTRRVLERVADVATRRGEDDLALVALRRISAAAPADRQVQLRLADVLRRLGRFEEAEAVYKAQLAQGGVAAR